MTMPVVMPSDENSEAITVAMAVTNSGNFKTMQFILPSKYTTVESAPVPTNKNVQIVMVPEKLVSLEMGWWWESKAK